MTSAVDFNWNEEAVAIPRQCAIAVHLTEHFDVVIRQQSEAGQPDAVIEIAHQNCLALCAAILREAAEHQIRIVRLPDGVMITGDGQPMHLPRDIADKLFQRFDQEN